MTYLIRRDTIFRLIFDIFFVLGGSTMFFVLFAFWLILNGQWTLEIAITGLVLSAALYLFIWKYMDYSPRKEWECFRRLPRALRYFVYLVGEVFKAAWATLKLIWSPKLVVQPELTTFRTHLRTRSGKIILANSITMTPGTITVDIRGDQYLIHCLDESMAKDIGVDMEKRISRLEEGGSRHDRTSV